MMVPAAILIGCTIVAAGLFFGLRSMAPAPPGPVAVASETAPTPTPTPEPGPVVAREVVAQQAAEALAYHRGLLVERCRPPAGATLRYSLDVTFDPQGAQVSRGIREDRENPRTAVARCISEALPALSVPAPGAVTMVEVPLSLP